MASFFIRKQKNGGWSLMEQAYENKKSIQKTIHKLAYPNLGFEKTWDVEKAKEHCRALNKQEKYKREEQHKISRIATRINDLNIEESLFLPIEYTEPFHKVLMQRSFGSEKHQARIHSHWKYIQKMINILKIEPNEYADNKERVYEYFLKGKISPDYCNKLLRILNMFGMYVCKRKRLLYELVPTPNFHIRNKIDETYQDSEEYIGESDPLTPDMLVSCQAKINNDAYYKWLWISVWFGLRPIEIDSLLKSANWKIERLVSENLTILHVYQSKLTSIKREKRWKRIPLYYPEQITALEYIKEHGFKRPTRFALKRAFDGFITCYAGRKGFVSLMLSKDQPLEAISSWMGHQDISITWKKYRDKENIIFGKRTK